MADFSLRWVRSPGKLVVLYVEVAEARSEAPVNVDSSLIAMLSSELMRMAQISAAQLVGLEQEARDAMLGERLYALVCHVDRPRAGKITGMLLEMQVGEVVAMLNSQDELLGRIAEALDVLEEEGLILAAADARSTAAAAVLPTSIATADAPVVAAVQDEAVVVVVRPCPT